MLIGYARISTTSQSLDSQVDALTAAGCEKIFTDQKSGSSTDRPGLHNALTFIRSGDTLVVCSLDRLGRSLQHLIHLFDGLSKRGVGIKSLTEQVDTTTAAGNLMFHVFASLAEFERQLIRERTNAGLAAARARGRQGGRPKVVADSRQLNAVRRAFNERALSVQEIAQKFQISRATVYRCLSQTY